MKTKEALLHYVWKHRLYDRRSLRLSDGSTFEIIDTGIHNTNSGPDFFNAKIKIGDQLWAGNVEIHVSSSDWRRHRHDRDSAYNSVILHVSESVDAEIRDATGRLIPQWEMCTPQHLRDDYRFLLESDLPVPCLDRISEIPEIYLNEWKSVLFTERLDRKANDILMLLEEYKNDWNETFYIIFARHFGFGINNDAFEHLAKSLPLKTVLKHNSRLQSEALFLGQAGMLEEGRDIDEYYSALRKEYNFLRDKYGLTARKNIFRNMRTRPGSFPQVKIVQLAAIISRRQHLFLEFVKAFDTLDPFGTLNAEPDDYWNTHYTFGKTSVTKSKKTGNTFVRNLYINAILPTLFAYGKKNDNHSLMENVLLKYKTTTIENNNIIEMYIRAGIKVGNAGDTQALIQLRNEYCEKKKCIYCHIGHRLLVGGRNNEHTFNVP
ncbi:MAG: DUF2851 family protein [Dysgonamonadaceae bacterium]|jgi:hypothetical protein|nr:DUF2851 family protein [Dysgonamonadaceae bacterium]